MPPVAAGRLVVVIISGAGRGLGRAHALAFAREGARLVINDTGVERDGTGGDHGPADAVVVVINSAAGLTTIDSCLLAVMAGFSASVTVTVKVSVPGVCGVPEITPVAGFTLSPGGSPVTDHEYGVTPPVAASAWL